MKKALEFRPYAENLAQFDPALDYSLPSLAVLDQLLRCLRQGIGEKQVSVDQLDWFIVSAGAYYAEVLKTQNGSVNWSSSGPDDEPWLETTSGPIYPFRLIRWVLSSGTSDSLEAAAAALLENCQGVQKG